MGMPHQFILNRQRLKNRMVPRETGLLKVRQKKSQAVGSFRVAFWCFMTDTINMAINSHDHSASRTSLDHKPIRARKRGATLGEIKSPHKAGCFVYGGEGGIRTLDTLLTYTPLAGERLQPLGHFSDK